MIDSVIVWAKKQKRVTRAFIRREFNTDEVLANDLYLELIKKNVITPEGYPRDEKDSE